MLEWLGRRREGERVRAWRGGGGGRVKEGSREKSWMRELGRMGRMVRWTGEECRAPEEFGAEEVERKGGHHDQAGVLDGRFSAQDGSRGATEGSRSRGASEGSMELRESPGGAARESWVGEITFERSEKVQRDKTMFKKLTKLLKNSTKKFLNIVNKIIRVTSQLKKVKSKGGREELVRVVRCGVVLVLVEVCGWGVLVQFTVHILTVAGVEETTALQLNLLLGGAAVLAAALG